MITFSLNSDMELMYLAARNVLPREKNVSDYDNYEQVGVSEGFLKQVEKKYSESYTAVALGHSIVRNNKITQSKTECSFVSAEENEAGVMGVSEAMLQVQPCDASTAWLESLDLDVPLVMEVLDLIEDHIFQQEYSKGNGGPSITALLRKSLQEEQSGRCITKLTKLIERYNDLSFIQVSNSQPRLKDFLSDYDSLKGFVVLLLQHKSLLDEVLVH